MKRSMILMLSVLALILAVTSCEVSNATIYTVTYDANGSTSGETPAASSAVKGKSIIIRGNGELGRTGYMFIGWNTEKDGKGKEYYPGDEVELSSDMILYAEWVQENAYCTVVYNPDNGSEVKIESVQCGIKLTKPSDPVKEGWEFLYWTSGGKEYDFNSTVKENMVLTASWEQDMCTVTFSTDGTPVKALTVAYGTTVQEPVTTKDGAVFKGWLVDGETWDFSKGVTKDMTLTASWNTDVYSVTFRTETDDKVKEQSVSYGGTATDPEAELTREGYVFEGWTLDGESYDFSKTVTRDIVLVAKWSVYCTVTFVDEESRTVLATEQSIPYMETASEPSSPTKSGYSFEYWMAPDGSRYDFQSPVTGSIELRAFWRQLRCTVTFETDGSAVAPVTVDYDTPISEPETKKDGAVFKGWLVDGETWDFSKGVTKDMTLTASWNTDVYSVTFRTETDDKVKEQSVSYGGTATDPEAELTREGYVFEGWTLDGESYDFSKTVTRDIVLVAKWSVYCTVTFMDEDGETAIAELQEVPYMHTAAEPSVPTKPGYSFAYWIDSDGSMYNFQRPVYASMTLKASWKPNEYTVTYNANGATATGDDALPENATYTYGEEITISGITTSKLSSEGRIFDGWTLSADGSGDVYRPGDTVKGKPEDMVLYAKWTDPEYTVGSTGPSGGRIVAVNSDSSAAGWKYIEAAPDCLSASYPFGYCRSEVVNNVKAGTAEALGKGRENTEKLVSLLGGEAPVEEESRSEEMKDSQGTYTHIYNIKGAYGAKACYDYSMENGNVTYDDWYLPSRDEMDAFYSAFPKGIPTGEYLTSSEESETKCTTYLFVTTPVPEVTNLYRRQYRAETSDKSKSLLVWPVRYI